MDYSEFLTSPETIGFVVVGILGFVAGFVTAFILLHKRMNNKKAERQEQQINFVFLVAAIFYVLTPLIGLGEPRSEVLIFLFALASGGAIGSVAMKIVEKWLDRFNKGGK